MRLGAGCACVAPAAGTIALSLCCAQFYFCPQIIKRSLKGTPLFLQSVL